MYITTIYANLKGY